MIYQTIDWELLKQQKLALLELLGEPAVASNSAHRKALDGLLDLIDSIQDDASAQGFPVQFLTEDNDPPLVKALKSHGIPVHERSEVTGQKVIRWHEIPATSTALRIIQNHVGGNYSIAFDDDRNQVYQVIHHAPPL